MKTKKNIYNDNEVMKPRVVIHIGNRLDKLENQIYYFLLELSRKQFNKDSFNKKLKEENKDKRILISRIYETTIGEIDSFFKIYDFKKTKKHLETLLDTKCKIDIFDKNYNDIKETHKEVYFHLLSKMTITDNNKVEMVFPDFVELEIEKPQFFTLFDMGVISNFKSKFSLILYENTKSYIVPNNPNCQIPYMTIETFKELMGVEDISSYSDYGNLKRKVIKPSVNEINKSTDTDISFEEVKEGRKVVGLQFNSYKKKPVLQEQGSSNHNLLIIQSDEFIVFKEQYIPTLEEGTVLSDNQGGDYIYNQDTKELSVVVGKRNFPIPKDKEEDIYLDLYENRTKSNWFKDSDLKYLVKNYKSKMKMEEYEDKKHFTEEEVS